MPDAGEIKKRFFSPINFFFSESVKSKHTNHNTDKSLKSFTDAAVPSHNLVRHVPYRNSTLRLPENINLADDITTSKILPVISRSVVNVLM